MFAAAAGIHPNALVTRVSLVASKFHLRGGPDDRGPHHSRGVLSKARVVPSRPSPRRVSRRGVDPKMKTKTKTPPRGRGGGWGSFGRRGVRSPAAAGPGRLENGGGGGRRDKRALRARRVAAASGGGDSRARAGGRAGGGRRRRRESARGAAGGDEGRGGRESESREAAQKFHATSVFSRTASRPRLRSITAVDANVSERGLVHASISSDSRVLALGASHPAALAPRPERRRDGEICFSRGGEEESARARIPRASLGAPTFRSRRRLGPFPAEPIDRPAPRASPRPLTPPLPSRAAGRVPASQGGDEGREGRDPSPRPRR